VTEEIQADNEPSNDLERDLSDEDLIHIAKERFKLCSEHESENRKEELDDLRFMVGDQWPLDIKTARTLDMRPCLTINRIPQFVRQVTNDQRQNRPSIKVNPVDDDATKDTAKVFEGIIRHIEYNSHADVAYDVAFESAVKSGIGYFRIVTDYVDEMSFQQQINIKQVKDRFAVHLDPYYQEPDGSDANFGFISEDVSRDEFKAQFPDSKLSTMAEWEALGKSTEGWVNLSSVRVAEYYYKVFESTDILLLSDQSVMTKKDFDKLPDGLPSHIRVVSERTSLVPKIKWIKINGLEILDRAEILGKWIPIIPVVGEEQTIEGKRILSGIIRHAKDPQRMYNIWKSAQAEMIALAPKAPYVGAAGSFEGFEDKWKTANTKNHAFLEYNPQGINGQPNPPPQRNAVEPPIQALTLASGEAADDMKATTGVYDATLGNRSNEQSGIAIQRRNTQSQISNFHFMDNLSRSIRHAGRILLNWIPQVLDTAQAARIIGEDGEVDFAKINQVFQEAGEDKAHFLDVGNYDVAISTGPSYETKRQEATASMLDLAKAIPQAMQMGLDLIVKSMDWPGSDILAERIKKSLPPQITADDKDQKAIPPQVQQQMQQLSQQNQMLVQELNKTSQLIEQKSLELASKERIALSQQKTQLAIELMKHNQKDSQFIFDKETEHIDRQIDIDNSQLNNATAGTAGAAPQGQQLQQQSLQPNGSGPQGIGSMGAPQ
jgi:hypothetical protein